MGYKVTIGIPAYNAGKYIERTLYSVLSQTFDSTQVLIVDDSSTDNTCDIIYKFKRLHPKGCDIHLLKQKVNMGVSAARNRIIKEAEGEYLYFMDSDDTIEPETISLLYSKVTEVKADVAFASYRKIVYDETNREIIENHCYPDLVFYDNVSFCTYAFRKIGRFQSSPWNYLIQVSLLRNNNIHFINVNYWEDAVFMMEMVTHMKKVVLCHNITYNYICRPNSLSNYQSRNSIPKSEIERNAFVVESMKKIAYNNIKKEYGSDINYFAIMFAFYTICGILGRRNLIVPSVSLYEMKKIIKTEISYQNIMNMNRRHCFHSFFWVLSKLPAFVSITVVWCLGRVKHII